jgi:hypothetical protein
MMANLSTKWPATGVLDIAFNVSVSSVLVKDLGPDQRLMLHKPFLVAGWLVFTQLVETSRPFVREASMVPVYALLAFGGQLEVLHDQGVLLLDGWAKFKAPARVSCWARGAAPPGPPPF